MDEIEAFADLHVGFDHHKFPPQPHSINPKAPAHTVSHDEAVIYLHDFDVIDAHGVTHELLHVQRYWVCGIPQIQPARNVEANLAPCSRIGNELEHLAIVPRERDYGFDSSKYWNAVARAKWNRWPWPEMSALDHRNSALLGRASLTLVTDLDVHKLAEEHLRTDGLTGEAERFANRINHFLSDKPRAALCAARFLKVPKGLLHLVYFDVRNRTRQIAEMPDH